MDDDDRYDGGPLGSPGRWLWVAAALTVAVAAMTDGDDAALVTVSLFLLWRVWRGGHVAWVLSGTWATLGALLFGVSALAPGGVPDAPVLAALHLALTAVLLGRPVRRLVGRSPVLAPPRDRPDMTEQVSPAVPGMAGRRPGQ